ncbi:MAG: hypothetical protein ACTSPG_04235 [Candidatus Hodarchaeales archaeon]
MSSLLELYRDAALGHPTNITRQFWGDIPTSYEELKKMVEERRTRIRIPKYDENLEKLRKIAEKKHREYGTYTEGVRASLDQLTQGMIDVGHQPLFLGGQIFLFNKVSLTEWLGSFLDLGTLFFVGDHDSIQNELTIARLPQANSPSGLTIAFSSKNFPELTPMHHVTIPKEKWFKMQKQKILENLRLLMKYAKVKVEFRQLLIERFYSWFNLIYSQAVAVKDFSSWTQRIWSQIFHIVNDMEFFMTPSSSNEYRKLVLPAFEFLLNEDNRAKYISTLNSVYEDIISKGLQPGLAHRAEDYTPFYLECLKCPTRTRVELFVYSPGNLVGKCPNCDEEYSFSYNPSNPDLSEIGTDITPRSDSRAVINNFTFPIIVHVGGGGETQYYSAVLPAMRRLEVLDPVLIRSNRLYYNTPWGQKSAQDNNTPILSTELYEIFSLYNDKTNSENAVLALELMRKKLRSLYDSESSILHENKNQLKKNQKDKKLRLTIKKKELMLSHNFGAFTEGKKVQEVSWNWLDLTVLTGLENLKSIFQRQLKKEVYPGHTWYVNPGKFT